jgi:hypothetical protein
VTDLFGKEFALTPPERKQLNRKSTVPRGHAALPGTGPQGETCGSCNNLARIRYAKTYLKCGLMKAHWTGGPKTDVRARDAACKRWEKKQP